MKYDFKTIKLKDCCSFQEGYVNPSQSHPEYFGGSIKWIRAVDLNNANVYNTTRTLSEIGFQSAGKSALLFEPNTIVISKSGTIGRLGIIKEYMCGNRATINIKPKENIDLTYLFYFLRSKQKEFEDLAVGSVQKNLYVSILESIEISLPSLPLQRKIVSIVKDIDEKIELNNAINNNLEQQADALYQAFFSPKSGTQGKIVKLDEYCSIFTGKKNANASVDGGKYKFFTCAPEALQIDSYIYDGNAIIVSGNGAYTGRTRFYSGKFDLYQRTYACTLLDSINPDYIFPLYWFVKLELSKKIMGGTRGSAIPYIVMNDLAKFEFVYNADTFSKYLPVFKSLTEAIQSNEFEIENLAMIRDTLLPKLMSGELDVSDIDL